MKKNIMKMIALVLLLAIAVSVTGCGGGQDSPQGSEQSSSQESAQQSDAAASTENDAEADKTEEIDETGESENAGTESGSQQKEPADKAAVDEYMASVKEQSDALKYSLENDMLSQIELNEKANELYELWDGALNYLWGELKSTLPEDEFAKLLEEQRAWIADKEARVAEAGKEVEGGSLYPLVTNTEAAAITEERVYELYEMLK